MQSTGHSSTQVRSFTSMQGSQIVYVMTIPSPYLDGVRRANASSIWEAAHRAGLAREIGASKPGGRSGRLDDPPRRGQRVTLAGSPDVDPDDRSSRASSEGG